MFDHNSFVCKLLGNGREFGKEGLNSNCAMGCSVNQSSVAIQDTELMKLNYTGF